MKQTKYITVRVEVDHRSEAVQLFNDIAALVMESLGDRAEESGRYTVHLGYQPSSVESLAATDPLLYRIA